MQDAFVAATRDPDLLAEADQAHFELNPNPGPVTAQIVDEILSLPPDLAQKLADIRK